VTDRDGDVPCRIPTKGHPGIHRRFLARLKQLLPPECVPVVVTDAGFKQPMLVRRRKSGSVISGSWRRARIPRVVMRSFAIVPDGSTRVSAPSLPTSRRRRSASAEVVLAASMRFVAGSVVRELPARKHTTSHAAANGDAKRSNRGP